MARKAQADLPDSPAAATLAIRLLAAAGKARRANKLAETTWAKAPHPDVAAAYAGIKADEGPIDRLRRLEKLVRANPEHAESRFALAEAALAAQLWGEARRHLSTLRHRDPALGGSARLCRLMAELEKAERGDLAAAEAWLEKAADAPPSATWVCGKCGATTAAWTAVCGNCGAFDSISWRPPPRVAPMPPPAELLLTETIEAAAEPPPPEPEAKPEGDTEVVPLRSAGS
jgi:HemY protein